ncbi:MAG: hypothetical protein IPG06_02320 [Haliea sp.]|nr:hypothetical protein [Haliea sp.]
MSNIENAAGDVPLAFLIIPDEYRVNDELWQAVVEKNDLPLQRDLPQVKIREWAGAGDRDIVDLLPLLLAEEPLPDGQRHLYHLRDSHFNARGNAIAGRALAKLIEAKLTEEKKPGVAIETPGGASSSRSNDLPQSVPAPEPSPGDQATQIMIQFGTVVADMGLDGSKVFDESLLNHPKGEILSAIVTILNGDIAADQKAFCQGGCGSARFLPAGAGEGGVAIDSMRSDQHTWRSVVEAEMQHNSQEVTSRTQGR